MDKLIRELREENERLKKMVEGGGMPADTSGRELSEYFTLLCTKTQQALLPVIVVIILNIYIFNLSQSTDLNLILQRCHK